MENEEKKFYRIGCRIFILFFIFTFFFLNIFLVCPIWLPVFFLFFYNEPELGVGIDPGMALTPLPSSIGLDGDRTHDLLIVSQVLYR